MIQNLLSLALRNKRTTGAGLVYLIASAFESLGPLWFPSKAHQCEVTGKWLRHMAVVYGLVASSDGQSALTKDEAETKFLKKGTP